MQTNIFMANEKQEQQQQLQQQLKWKKKYLKLFGLVDDP